KDSNSASALWDSHWLKVIDIAAQSIARGTMEGQCRTMDLKGGRALSANRVDTAVVVAAVAAASIGALGLIGVLVQAWMGLTPSPFLTYLPMLLRHGWVSPPVRSSPICRCSWCPSPSSWPVRP